ncbi:MAG: MFS transporter [Desulfobacterales bacterium]|jgi:MFS family permease
MNPKDIKTFCVLFLAVLTAVTGVGIVVPLLPVYARDIGAGGFYIGMIFGIFSISRTAFIPYFGRASDRRGRKPFILVGLLGYAAVAVAFYYTTSVTMLITIRFFQGICSAMMMPVLQAYVGDITPDGREGLTMGIFNLATFVGLGLGPLFGGIISDHWGLQAAFACMGALALSGFGLNWWGLPPRRHEKAFSQHAAPVAWRHLLGNREIIGLMAFRMAYTTCIGVIWGFLPIYADQSLHLSRTAIGALIMTGVMVSGIVHVPMGYLSDRLSKSGMVITGGILAAMGVLTFHWAQSLSAMLWSSTLFGLGGGIAMPALMGLVVIQGTHLHAMGAVMALLSLGHSAGMMAGALVAGLLMDRGLLDWAFPFGALVMLSGVIGFQRLFSRKAVGPEPPERPAAPHR